MCHIDHERARARLALRMADVLGAKGVDADTAETFGPGFWHQIAQVANQLTGHKGKTEQPGAGTAAVCIEIMRHNEARRAVEAESVGAAS